MAFRNTRALKWSLIISCFLLVIKVWAYYVTTSIAVLSDAAESIVHVAAVAFALYSANYANLPADDDHPYGHDRIAFFSSGVEGALLFATALIVGLQSFLNFFHGSDLHNLTNGLWLISISFVINISLGSYLIVRGRKNHSIIVETNGHHILSDAVTSAAVFIGLLLVSLTGNPRWDALSAIALCLYLLYTSYVILKKTFHGLMDRAHPELLEKIRKNLEEICQNNETSFHDLRARDSGQQIRIEFHFVTPENWTVQKAHDVAVEVEQALISRMGRPCDVLSHLEPEGDTDR